MRRFLPRFKIRTLLLLLALVSCVLAIGDRARRIHYAAKFIQANGGDVWLGETLYTGGGLGTRPRRTSQLIFDRAKIVSNLICGGETELWVCFIPEDREPFVQALELLRPKAINFDVLGTTDRAWLLKRFTKLELGSVCTPDHDAENPWSDEGVEMPQNIQATTESVKRREFVRSMELVERWFAENPRTAYRLERYETLIGYPDHGEMGRLLDHETGRIIYLPWPK